MQTVMFDGNLGLSYYWTGIFSL